MERKRICSETTSDVPLPGSVLVTAIISLIAMMGMMAYTSLMPNLSSTAMNVIKGCYTVALAILTSTIICLAIMPLCAELRRMWLARRG